MLTTLFSWTTVQPSRRSARPTRASQPIPPSKREYRRPNELAPEPPPQQADSRAKRTTRAEHARLRKILHAHPPGARARAAGVEASHGIARGQGEGIGKIGAWGWAGEHAGECARVRGDSARQVCVRRRNAEPMPLHLQTSSVNMQNDQVRRRSIDTRSGRAGAERMKRLGWADRKSVV